MLCTATLDISSSIFPFLMTVLIRFRSTCFKQRSFFFSEYFYLKNHQKKTRTFIWGYGYYKTTDQIIAHEIIVSFYIFSLLSYDRILSVKIWSMILRGKINSLTQHFAGGHYQVWSLKFVLVLFFMTHLSSYDNIFVTEIWQFSGNMKVLLEDLYTHWTSEVADITRRLTKW